MARAKKRPVRKHDLTWDHKLIEEMGELIAEIGKMHGNKGDIKLVRDELADVQAALVIFMRTNFPRRRDRKAFARRVAMKTQRAKAKMKGMTGEKPRGKTQTLLKRSAANPRATSPRKPTAPVPGESPS